MEEGQTFDKKSMLTFSAQPERWDWQKIAKHCIAFANAAGGLIHFGIEDKHTAPLPGQRIPPAHVDRLRKGIAHHCVNVAVTAEIGTCSNGGEILELRIMPSRQNIASTTDGRYFIRVSDESRPVMPDELQRLVADKDAYVWEAQITRRIPMDNVDAGKFDRFMAALRSSERVSSFIKEKADSEILEHLLLAREGCLTNLGILWIGRREDRALLLHTPVIQFIKYDDHDQKVFKREWADYNLNPQELVESVLKEIPDWREFTEIRTGLFADTVPHYDESVLRELLINALSHRPYTTRGDIFISLYPDHLEIQNPGLFPLGVTSRNILHTSVQRNPHLSRIFYLLNLMESEGSGYDRIYDALLSRGRPVPELREENDAVIVRVDRRIVRPEVAALLAAVSRQYDLRQRERICLGLIAQHGVLKASNFDRILDLPDEIRIRSWLGSLLGKGIILSRGKTRATEYLVNPEWLRLLEHKGPTTLKKIEPHRLRHLVLEDLQTYSPEAKTASSPSEIHYRVGKEISAHKLRRALEELRKEGWVGHSGKTGLGSRYFITAKNSQIEGPHCGKTRGIRDGN